MDVWTFGRVNASGEGAPGHRAVPNWGVEGLPVLRAGVWACGRRSGAASDKRFRHTTEAEPFVNGKQGALPVGPASPTRTLQRLPAGHGFKLAPPRPYSHAHIRDPGTTSGGGTEFSTNGSGYTVRMRRECSWTASIKTRACSGSWSGSMPWPRLAMWWCGPKPASMCCTSRRRASGGA